MKIQKFQNSGKFAKLAAALAPAAKNAGSKLALNLDKLSKPLIEGQTMQGIISLNDWDSFFKPQTGVSYDEYIKDAFEPINLTRFDNLSEQIMSSIEELRKSRWHPGTQSYFYGADGRAYPCVDYPGAQKTRLKFQIGPKANDPWMDAFFTQIIGNDYAGKTSPTYEKDGNGIFLPQYSYSLLKKDSSNKRYLTGTAFADSSNQTFIDPSTGRRALRTPATILTEGHNIYPIIGSSSIRANLPFLKTLINILGNSHGAFIGADTSYPTIDALSRNFKYNALSDFDKKTNIQLMLAQNFLPSNGYSIGSYKMFSPKSRYVSRLPHVLQTYALGNSGQFNIASDLVPNADDRQLYEDLKPLWKDSSMPAYQKQFLIETKLNPYLTSHGFLPGFMLGDTAYFGHPVLYARRQGGKINKQ